MPFAHTEHVGDGADTTFSIGFPYLQKAFLIVEVDALELDLGVDWDVDGGGTNVVFDVAPANGAEIMIRRETDRDTKIVDWTSGARITERNLDRADDQLFHILQEIDDDIGGAEENANSAELDAAAAASSAASATASAAAAAASAAMIGTFNLTGPTTGDAIVWSGTEWVDGEPGTMELDDLTDVVITTPATGAVLTYDGANWIDAAPAGVTDLVAPAISLVNTTGTGAGSVGADTTVSVVVPATGNYRIAVKALIYAQIEQNNAPDGIGERDGHP